jgi:hypothetical protein
MALLFDDIPVSSNRIEIVVILPENESHREKAAYSHADSVLFAQKRNYEK